MKETSILTMWLIAFLFFVLMLCVAFQMGLITVRDNSKECFTDGCLMTVADLHYIDDLNGDGIRELQITKELVIYGREGNHEKKSATGRE